MHPLLPRPHRSHEEIMLAQYFLRVISCTTVLTICTPLKASSTRENKEHLTPAANKFDAVIQPEELPILQASRRGFSCAPIDAATATTTATGCFVFVCRVVAVPLYLDHCVVSEG